MSSDERPLGDGTQLAQPKDAVQMQQIERKQEREGGLGGLATKLPPPPPAEEGIEDAGAGASSSPKGKAKHQAYVSEADGNNDDSLSINPSGPAERSGSPDPATDADNADALAAPPVCNITLLLTTGARHPYRIDQRYLEKRNVDIPDTTAAGHPDPFSISVYKLKELILREWRDEWDNKPASPSSIRLIHFGKLLEDKEPIQRYQLSLDSPNVVHMTVRPAEMVEEDEAAKGKSSARNCRTRQGGGGGGGCCVIL